MALLIINTTNAADTLLARATTVQRSTAIGDINSIRITNTSTNAAVVSLFYDNAAGVDFYIIKNVNIPVGAAIFLDQDLSFNRSAYDLKVTNSGSSPSLTIIIK
tara:strand:- start:2429 stop:2740 length:312 start_codon:yes stop_codon:yes gene_type:complete